LTQREAADQVSVSMVLSCASSGGSAAGRATRIFTESVLSACT
jgi:hypothetical protein